MGERIHVCTSDDGFTDPDAAGVAVDAVPGVENPVADPERIGAEILLAPPDPTACVRAADCAADEICVDAAPFAAPNLPARVCAHARPVVADGLGACDAATGPGRFQSVVADRAGEWRLALVGEPETLRPGEVSTRYFAVEVEDAQGQAATAGRLHATIWHLETHDPANGVTASFLTATPVQTNGGPGSAVFRLSLSDLQGYEFGISTNSTGVAGHPDTSWCAFGEPAAGPRCPFFGAGPAHAAAATGELYLSYPQGAAPAAPPAAISALTFEDAVGSATITPDGDGVQDTGSFAFTTAVEGLYRVTVDTDRNGTPDPAHDWTVTGAAGAGRNTVPWNGRDPQGAVVPAGTYGFRVEVRVAETHFPLFDVSGNAAGFVTYQQAGPGAALQARRMFWDDTAARGAGELVPGGDDALSTLPDGSVVPSPGIGRHQRRRWQQRVLPNPAHLDARGNPLPEGVPVLFDTWVFSERAVRTQATCARCAAPVDGIVVGGVNEAPPPDADGDGIPDAAEDLNGNGRVDLEESDPNRVDTDGDGLPDGIEDANHNGRREPGETHPNVADSDGDGLSDGVEDANHNGRVDPGETNPLSRDTDGDGLPDNTDPEPAGPIPPDAAPLPPDAALLPADGALLPMDGATGDVGVAVDAAIVPTPDASAPPADAIAPTPDARVSRDGARPVGDAAVDANPSDSGAGEGADLGSDAGAVARSDAANPAPPAFELLSAEPGKGCACAQGPHAPVSGLAWVAAILICRPRRPRRPWKPARQRASTPTSTSRSRA